MLISHGCPRQIIEIDNVYVRPRIEFLIAVQMKGWIGIYAQTEVKTHFANILLKGLKHGNAVITDYFSSPPSHKQC